MLLGGRVAVVSGAGAGLGRSIALTLAREGADIALLARTRATAESIVQEVEALGRRAICVSVDITDPAACADAVSRTLDAFGRVDVLVNNAFATGPIEPIASSNIMKSWRPPFKVNVFGTLQLSQAFARPMQGAKSGSIVMIASMAARRVERDLAAYGASKAALLYAAKALASELGPDGLRVNSVVPGHIEGMSLDVYFQMEASRLGITPTEARQRVAGQSAMNKIASPDDVASAVLFFASDLSSAVTGQALDVNYGHWFH